MSDAWTVTLDRLRTALLAWAETQTPAWLRGKLDACDLVQQTHLEALRLGDKLAGRADAEVLAYLRRVPTNNLIDATRKHQRSANDVSPEAAAESSNGLAKWLEAADTSPSERVARQERFTSLAAGLARLPDAQRIAVESHYLRGERVAEVARVLGRTEGAVMALLHRAVTSLRQDLGLRNT